MNKRLWLIIIVVITSLVFFIILNAKRIAKPKAIKKDGVVSAVSLLNQAKGFESKGSLLDAKGVYQKLINEFPNSNEITNWQKKVEDINIKLLFSSLITPGSTLYEIRPQDTLTKIAKEFKTTTELIKKSNGLSDDKILPGRKIKVWTMSFNIVVDKSQNTLILMSGDEIIKTYIVSTGANSSTPIGNYKITDKLINPTWFKAGAVVPSGSPENILGSRWLGFTPGYGIHGTTEPQNLGKQITQGCVRMSNSDAEELYTIVSLGTEVTIVD